MSVAFRDMFPIVQALTLRTHFVFWFKLALYFNLL